MFIVKLHSEIAFNHTFTFIDTLIEQSGGKNSKTDHPVNTDSFEAVQIDGQPRHYGSQLINWD